MGAGSKAISVTALNLRTGAFLDRTSISTSAWRTWANSDRDLAGVARFKRYEVIKNWSSREPPIPHLTLMRCL